MSPHTQVPLKNPFVAGILAFLLPGAGHLYQGRMFKAGLYSLCILGLFFTGMAMAEWQAVQTPPPNAIRNREGTAVLKYAAQAGVGLPALYGLIARERYQRSPNRVVVEIDQPLTAPFEGEIELRDEGRIHQGILTGTIRLEPFTDQFGTRSISGRIEGTLDGEPLTVDVARVQLDPALRASKRRGLSAVIVRSHEGREQAIGHIRRASIPRGFWQWFQIPMEPAEVRALHARLGKHHELAMVFTWIAGLLNLLAIWDAVEGPAYGYGDEEDEESPAKNEPVPA